MRLTKYEPNDESIFPYKLKDEELSTELDSIHKLGQLEDIENELGIDLILYLKVMIHRIIYIKGKEPEWAGLGTKKDIESYCIVNFTKDELVVSYRGYGSSYNLHTIKNPMRYYKKIWALTKEALL